jgi:hypothetical protein
MLHEPGLPDGLFSKIPIWVNFGGPWNCRMLVYFMAIWNKLLPFGVCSLWPFSIVCGHLVYFFRFGTFGQRKIWQPCSRLNARSSTVKKLLIGGIWKQVHSRT